MKAKKFTPDITITTLHSTGEPIGGTVAAERIGDWAVSECLCPNCVVDPRKYYAISHVRTTGYAANHRPLNVARAIAAGFDAKFPRFRSWTSRTVTSQGSAPGLPRFVKGGEDNQT